MTERQEAKNKKVETIKNKKIKTKSQSKNK